MAHELRLETNSARPYWFCTCTRAEGPGWVCVITQPRKGSSGGKPDRAGAEFLHRRHIEDCDQPEEEWWPGTRS